MDIHDKFNDLGGWVYNLRGERFYLEGDKHLSTLRKSHADSVSVYIAAVRASLGSLIYAADQLRKASGKSSAKLPALSVSPPFLKALSFIPIFVESEKHKIVAGQYTRYAEAIFNYLKKKIPSDLTRCLIPATFHPDLKKNAKPYSQKPCTTWPVTAEKVSDSHTEAAGATGPKRVRRQIVVRKPGDMSTARSAKPATTGGTKEAKSKNSKKPKKAKSKKAKKRRGKAMKRKGGPGRAPMSPRKRRRSR
jgi:hypothetical protein